MLMLLLLDKQDLIDSAKVNGQLTLDDFGKPVLTLFLLLG